MALLFVSTIGSGETSGGAENMWYTYILDYRLSDFIVDHVIYIISHMSSLN